MKKSDLRTGMIVEWQDGTKLVVFRDVPNLENCIVAGSTWMPLFKYEDDLTNKDYPHVNINKVYQPSKECALGKYDQSLYDIIWKRSTTRQITIDGKTIDISEESFQALKRTLMEG